ncbi:MAG: hypothetical protein JNK82_34040 [Myxococcaceae bacterium]|nr:hypothetical protein [Myxococcaceae bacterium]
MKKLKLEAPKEELRARCQKQADELKAQGAPRVLVVYDDPEHARVYPEQRPTR